MNEIFGFDAFSSSQIAERIESIGVSKARLPILSLIMLGILAGAFIALGAMSYVLIISDQSLNFASSRLLSGFVFSLGLIMVIIAGAELFTGNNLLIMAWAESKISSYELIRNWVIVCLANFIGAVAIAVLVYYSNHLQMNNGDLRITYLKIANAKCSLSWQHAYFSGILCNILVCLAVWMSQAGRSVIDKVVVIIFPVAAFVSAGFEHSIANMYLITMGILIHSTGSNQIGYEAINIAGLFGNLIPVILGNLTGGAGFVFMFYYIIYKKNSK